MRAPPPRGARRWAWHFLRPYIWLLVASVLSVLVTVAITLSIPLVVRAVLTSFDAAATQPPSVPFAWAALLAILAAAAFSVRFYLIKLLGERVVADVRRAIFAHMIPMSPAFYERMMTGDVIARITADTAILLNVIGWSLLAAVRHVLVLAGALAMLAATSLKLTALVLAGVPLVVVPIVVLGRRLRAQSRASQDMIAASTGAASEALSAAQTVQAFTNEGLRIAQFDRLAQRAFEAARGVVAAHVTMNGAVIFLSLAGILGVVWVGATDVRAGAMTGADLVQFILFAMFVAEAANGLTNSWGEMQRGAGTIARITELLDAADTVTDPATPQPVPDRIRGEVQLAGVGFTYPSRPDAPALNDIDLHVPAGQTVALVGPSGAGKSTILHLLLRFYDPERGAVRIDGADLRQMQRSAFRRHIALVPQDPVILAATARDNIRFGTPEASDDDVARAAQAAAAHGFVSALPQGYDTFLGEEGVMLSGGQKQRIAIARAILRDAPILLLDEATSALDADSERAVQGALEALSAGRTSIVIAHRLSTVRRADRIVVLEGGRVVATGTHDALMAEGGLYARLARLQFTDTDARS